MSTALIGAIAPAAVGLIGSLFGGSDATQGKPLATTPATTNVEDPATTEARKQMLQYLIGKIGQQKQANPFAVGSPVQPGAYQAQNQISSMFYGKPASFLGYKPMSAYGVSMPGAGGGLGGTTTGAAQYPYGTNTQGTPNPNPNSGAWGANPMRFYVPPGYDPYAAR